MNNDKIMLSRKEKKIVKIMLSRREKKFVKIMLRKFTNLLLPKKSFILLLIII